MTPIKLLNNLLFIEKLLGIYRNYCDQTKIKKRFIISQAFSLIILHFIAMIGEIILLLESKFSKINCIYGCFYALCRVNSVSSIVTAIYYSRDFKSYYRSISRVTESFNGDTKLIKSFKKLNWFSIILVLNYIGFLTYRSVRVLIIFSHANPFFLATSFLSQLVMRFSIVFQYLMLFVIIMLVVHSFKSLTSLVSTAQERVGNCDISSDKQCDITSEQIREWVDLYRDLANCCKKATLCFGRQFFFTLTISTSFHVLNMYETSYTIITESGNTDELKKSGLITCVYLTIMVIPIVAGQLACNQGAKFHRILARLYNTRIIDSHEAEVKLLKDFIRLIKKNPTEIQFFPKVPAEMYMLPVILSLVVDYIIILLQFNHII